MLKLQVCELYAKSANFDNPFNSNALKKFLYNKKNRFLNQKYFLYRNSTLFKQTKNPP